MTDEVKILQIGGSNIKTVLEQQSHTYEPSITWIHMDDFDDMDALQKELPNVVLLYAVDEIMENDRMLALLDDILPTYACFIMANAEQQCSLKLRKILQRKICWILHQNDLVSWYNGLTQRYFRGQYGEHYSLKDYEMHPVIGGTIHFEGNGHVTFSGDFGDHYQQVISWRRIIPLTDRMLLDFYLEYQTLDSSELELKLRVIALATGSLDQVTHIYEFTDELMQGRPMHITESHGERLTFSLMIRGRGSVSIGHLHTRFSRENVGILLAGGKRIADYRKEELFYYFEPGDAKPPLNVYFSGYRTAEGFEGYFMMKKLGHPFLLIADPRMEGGQYYLGSDELEKGITEVISNALHKLGFTHRQMTMSGLSMGTFGAVYYGSKLNPRALVLGKPLLNGGNIAQNVMKLRPRDFATSLDVLLTMQGGLEEEDVLSLNNRMWNRIDEKSFKDTIIAVAYMEHDDYDPTAYKDLVKRLEGSKTTIYGKSIIGRHNDNTAAVVAWFIMQYKKILDMDWTNK